MAHTDAERVLRVIHSCREKPVLSVWSRSSLKFMRYNQREELTTCSHAVRRESVHKVHLKDLDSTGLNHDGIASAVNRTTFKVPSRLA